MRRSGSERQQSSGTDVGRVSVELIRLAVVALAAAITFDLIGGVDLVEAGESAQLAVLVVGVGVGYVLGGVVGRFAVGRIDATERRLRSVSAGELLASLAGTVAGIGLGAALTWPALLFDQRRLTFPIAALVIMLCATTGLRIGAARGGDLLRFLGASGRIDVTTGASGARARVVDTSALIDGRLLDVCRAGFIEGTLVVPRVVLYELQGLADAGDDERRLRGRRGLDVLSGLQRCAGVALEVTEQDHPELGEVDAKLVAIADDRRAALVTVDGNLARVAEVQGVKVLNLHALSEVLRPPVLPGDDLAVRVVKPGKEMGQGVGYLGDGTMVVIEGAREWQGVEIQAEVTSILSNAHGRMVFATRREAQVASDA